jgi:hypothetical protein
MSDKKKTNVLDWLMAIAAILITFAIIHWLLKDVPV